MHGEAAVFGDMKIIKVGKARLRVHADVTASESGLFPRAADGPGCAMG